MPPIRYVAVFLYIFLSDCDIVMRKGTGYDYSFSSAG